MMNKKFSLFSKFRVCLFPFCACSVRIGGQGAPVRLGWCARLISSLLLFLFRRNLIFSVFAVFSPCPLLLVFNKNGAACFV